ncbi:MAG: tetratricopeptide repeat protein [Pseudomonadota bacterium]
MGNRMLRLTGLVGLALLISGCAFNTKVLTLGLLGDDDAPKEIRAKGPKIGKVVDRLPALNLPDLPPVKPSRDEVMAAYNAVYGMLPSATENYSVGKRLADLHMEVGEEQDIEGVATPYNPAIDLYESLLAQSKGAEGVDEILYQLARAYDLTGDHEPTKGYLDRLIAEYPDSPYIPEARFRRAELYFSKDDYRAATADYEYVVNLGETTPYYRNSAYMLGWAEFKRSRFDEGLHQFLNVLDSLLVAVEGDESQLSSIQRELLNDTFRVVTLALSYLDGPLTLADEMRRRDKPEWQYLAYQKLASDYFEKERYLDNVATWQTFIEHNSLDIRAPAAHKGMIKTLMDAGFPSDVIPKKKAFIERYGVYSDFWQHHPADVRSSYLDTLHTYLSEISKLAHADAQNYLARQEKLKSKLRDKDPTTKRIVLFLDAARWYEEIVVTFPEDPRTAQYLFLLGESYTEAVQPGRAVAAYQRVVREFPGYERAPEAGYAAILGLSELISTSKPEELELWQRLKIDAQIEFALIFPGDPRAPSVQTDAADTLFTLGHTSQALDLAENLLLEWPDVDATLRKTALLIIGHGRFEQDEFAEAEVAYNELLVGDLSKAEHSKVFDRLLAAVYKQGEAAEVALEVDAAVHHFLRIAGLSATAPLAAQGHFDAVAVLETAGRVDEAATLLNQFRTTYPGHRLGEGVDMRLAGMYEKTSNWQAAATEYLGLSKTAADKDVRRQSLYRAAELYLDLDDVPNAIEHFRDYAHTYKQPQDLRMEAMHHMDLLYQRTGEGDKRRFWLNKKVKLHKAMGGQATARATYLAADAQFIFAEDARRSFDGIRLTHPLKRSLKKKQNALKKALRAYEKVADYEVAEFTTASTFHIANLYVQLSGSILKSDRPENLSELEMAQYEILLEEQAFPFEEQAIGLHEINMRRAWNGVFDNWVERSFAELGRLMPGRFNKSEKGIAYVQRIH